MSGRHGRTASRGPDNLQGVTEEAADRITRILAGLRSQLLQTPEALEYPKVRIELQKLEGLVALQHAYADNTPGRHRSVSDGAVSQQANDIPGNEPKPDPFTANTPSVFIEALWQYRAWSGNPSWRVMADQAEQVVAFSTMYNAMNGQALPKLHVVRAIIIGCRGDRNDVSSFVNAWRRIAVSSARDRDWVPRPPDE
jgi:hypothetical protein